MAKPKLSVAQNMALQGLSLEEKHQILGTWLSRGEISREQFNFFSEKWMKRERKKSLKDFECPLPPKRPNPSVLEGEIRSFINLLQGSINDYLISREIVPLADDIIQKYWSYLQNARHLRDLINQLLVIGLRHPDKQLSNIAALYVKECKKSSFFVDESFWHLLWSDGNIVPMDAVRMMMKDESIDPLFGKHFIKRIIPMIAIQKENEAKRLHWAEGLTGKKRAEEVARKTQRLEAFTKLLEAANKYVV